MPIPILMPGDDCGVSDDCGGGFLFFFGFFDCTVDRPHTLTALIFNLAGFATAGVAVEYLAAGADLGRRAIPIGVAQPAARAGATLRRADNWGRRKAAAMNTSGGWQLPSAVGRVPSGQPHRLAVKASRVQQMPFTSGAPSLQTHLPSAFGNVPSGQPLTGWQTPSPIGRVPSGQPLTGWQMPSPI